VKAWKARVLLVALGLAPFVFLEVGLRLSEARSSEPLDLVTEGEIFVERDGEVHIHPRYERQFRPTRFAPHKTEGTSRIAVVGDSVTFGSFLEPARGERPYPEQLAQLLADRLSGRDVEVLNCGAVCHGTQQSAAVLAQILPFEPDLVVLTTGSSEVLESRYLEVWDRWGPAAALLRWRTLGLARQVLRRSAAGGGPPMDMAPPQGALPLVPSDAPFGPAEAEVLLEGSRARLASMALACRDAGVPLLLVVQPVNLRMPPNSWYEVYLDRVRGARPDFLDAAQAAQEAREGGDAAEALRIVEPVLTVGEEELREGDHWMLSLLHHQRGLARLARGDREGGTVDLIAARDLDALPTRSITLFEDLMSETADSRGVWLVDPTPAFAAAAVDGVPGEDLFFDDCHPRPAGHALYAQVIADAVVREGLLGAAAP